jgi:hypothetical protein
LGSRLQQWNLLSVDVNGLPKNQLQTYKEHWRLFIDSLKRSLKTVLLHNDNIFPSIPVGHAAPMKETYDNLKQLLKCINYNHHQWPRSDHYIRKELATKADPNKIFLPP